MIWEFWKWEKFHGKAAGAYYVVFEGRPNRRFAFANNPKKQRVCHCQKCRTRIPREVPRIRLYAPYYHSAGYYCLSCAKEMLKEKYEEFQRAKETIEQEMENLEELMKISEGVMNDEWYPKRMALGRMCQVMKEKVPST